MQKNQKQIQEAVKLYYAEKARAVESDCSCMAENITCCHPGQENTLDIGTKGYSADNLASLPSEVTGLSLGCGDPVTLASLIPGQTVVDLGSGGGIDCFLAASKVGPTGKVIGIDITDDMIHRARASQEKLGLENVEFRLGEIENLPIEDASVDVIISNCVINLSLDKLKVFHEAYRVLKPGGKFAVSDIVTAGNLPESVINSLSAWASCVGGALKRDEFLRLLENAGFVDIHIQPNYWDKEIFASYLDDDLSEMLPCCNDTGKKHEYTLNDIQSAIFSAKITAWKPSH
jgi:arsenite methyltransferase